jgi:hypothetical protein
MVAVLFKSLKTISKNSELITPRKEWICLSIALVSIGLLFFLLFSVSHIESSVFGFYYSYFFALFGATIGFGLLNAKSRGSFFLLLLMVLSLIIPAFVTIYPVEQRDIMRESVSHGLVFTGKHIDGQNAKILSPFGRQLYSFMNFNAWDNIVGIVYGDELFSQILYADYFIFRTDGLYFAAIEIEGVYAKESTYFRVFTASLNNSGFNLIYSSSEYQILARH